jgi:hypothetical protein
VGPATPGAPATDCVDARFFRSLFLRNALRALFLKSFSVRLPSLTLPEVIALLAIILPVTRCEVAGCEAAMAPPDIVAIRAVVATSIAGVGRFMGHPP